MTRRIQQSLVSAAGCEVLERRALFAADGISGAGDVNGDGRADVVVVNVAQVKSADGLGSRWESTVGVHLGNGDGTFRQSYRLLLPAVRVSGVAVGDINLDGRADLVVREADGSVRPGALHVLNGLADGTLGKPAVVGKLSGVEEGELHIADFNGDGTPDVGTNRNGIIAILIGLRARDGGGGAGAAAFGTPVKAQLPYSAKLVGDLAAGDFDGSGRAGIAVALGDGSVRYLKITDGTSNTVLLAEQTAFQTGFVGGIYVAAGDVNGDGVSDLVVSAGEGVGVALGATGVGLRTFARSGNVAPASSAEVVLGDVNGDGRDDVIVASGPGGGPHVRAYGAADGTLSATPPVIERELADVFAA